MVDAYNFQLNLFTIPIKFSQIQDEFAQTKKNVCKQTIKGTLIVCTQLCMRVTVSSTNIIQPNLHTSSCLGFAKRAELASPSLSPSSYFLHCSFIIINLFPHHQAQYERSQKQGNSSFLCSPLEPKEGLKIQRGRVVMWWAQHNSVSLL